MGHLFLHRLPSAVAYPIPVLPDRVLPSGELVEIWLRRANKKKKKQKKKKKKKEATPYESQIADLGPNFDPTANCGKGRRTPRVFYPASVSTVGKYEPVTKKIA